MVDSLYSRKDVDVRRASFKTLRETNRIQTVCGSATELTTHFQRNLLLVHGAPLLRLFPCQASTTGLRIPVHGKAPFKQSIVRSKLSFGAFRPRSSALWKGMDPPLLDLSESQKMTTPSFGIVV